jgi:hypothetical protein
MRDRSVARKRTPVTLLAIASSLTALALMGADARNVMAPGLASVVIVVWLWTTLWDRDQQIPFFDVGVFCALATLVYTVYPLLNYWAEGFQFGLLSDARLRAYNPDPAELGFFHLRHVLYLGSFVGSYSLFRGTGRVELGNVMPPMRSTRQLVLWLFLILTAYFFLLQLATGANFNATYEGEAYSNNLLAFASLPLPLLQISAKLAGTLFLAKLGCLFVVISRCRQRKWLIVLVVWVVAEVAEALILKGSRTGLVLFLMAAALFYHRMIKPLSMKFLLVSGISLLAFFLFLGLYRMYVDLTSMQTDLGQTNAGIVAGPNEFQALLGTAYDVFQRKNSGADLPWYLYINDFITVLPPQQLMPFEKIPASEWYLREIGESGTGVGFMWGVIAQSIVGLDWIELALRGAILGYILGRIHNWYVRHQLGFFPTLLYVYLCLRIYYTFRDTTFSLLADLVWVIIPFYFILRFGAGSLSRPRSRSGSTNAAIPLSPQVRT